MFIAFRCGDVINAFVGLWLVPQYVPADELGAVLALTNFATVFGIPITILVTVYTKFLNRYQSLGEKGKVKSLLSWFFYSAAVFTLASSLASILILPHFFERIRIPAGSLGMLIVTSGIVTAVSPVFSNALQGLKKFNALTIQNLLSAPVRLITMLVAIPYRALSGYMLGQLAAPLFTIGWATFNLRKEIRPEIESVAFWTRDAKRILSYLGKVSIWFLIGCPYAALWTMVIRQRLPADESAAYYIISRFAELATYAGVTMALIMFPLVAEAHTKGKNSGHILRNTNIGTIAFGLITTAVLYFFGEPILKLLPTTAHFSGYTTDMALLAAALVLNQIWTNFTSYEIAEERFGFLYYGTPLTFVQTVILVCFTGYTFFNGILPDYALGWMERLNLATLRHLLIFQLVANTLRILMAGTHAFLRNRLKD